MVYINSSGKIYLNKNFQFHREDGPAVEHADGGREWWIDGKLHREDGPAVIKESVTSYWNKGKLNRINGPAVIYANGAEEFWENGACLSQ